MPHDPDDGSTPVSAGEKSKGQRELTPNEVNAGVADATGAVDPSRRTQRSSGRRGARQTGRNREERSPRRG